MRFFTPKPDPKVDTLRSLPAFSSASRHQLDSAASTLDITEVAEGKDLVRQGERGTELYLILDGQARVCRDGHTIALVGPGELLGELALLGDGHRNATVTAMTDMIVATTTKPYLASLAAEIPGFADQLRRTSADRLSAA